MKIKAGIVSLGCPKNLVDSEVMLGQLYSHGFEITNLQEEAEVLIVNTCGFIEAAKQESINTILEMAEYKKQNCRLLIVTGCLSERYRDLIMQEIPEVDAVVGTGSYGEIINVIERAYCGEKPAVYGELEDISYLESNRLISTKNGYAYLKIAEGCDNCCTYCIIPSLRGRYRSRKTEDIIKEARQLSQKGVKELILVAQDTSRYGLDIYKEKRLVHLIRELSKIEGIDWIRLLYCYPEMIDDLIIDEMASNEKLLKYIDIPIQHASDKILKAMNRRGTSADIDMVLSKLRQRVSGIVIRTSLIVGFPGEEEEDFEILSDFVRKKSFDRLGVFTYSKEDGTPAALFKSQISKKIKEKRYKTIMTLQKEITRKKNESRLGKVYKTLVESVAEDGIFYIGRTYAEAPEIDPVVYFTSKEPLRNGEFVNVKILDADDYDLTGEVYYESGK
ncbi:MAG: 30S ribosomal protein S12 methylthiotransferase RimO [Clostridia bacterium]|nr:30S ribosomal protein S12 methylthiotransferase RimO [Clostridia bacterium]